MKKQKKDRVTLSEFIWTRIGFGIIGFLSGSVFFVLMFLPVRYFLMPDVDAGLAYKIFVGLFIFVSMVNEKLIGHSGLYAIYALFGAIHAFFPELSLTFYDDQEVKSMSSWRRELVAAFILGFVATLFSLALA
jgi:hypothetical protein